MSLTRISFFSFHPSSRNEYSFCGGNTIGNKPRDTALVEKIECTGDDAIFFACTSVETPRVPRVQGRVRADIKVMPKI